MGTLGLITPSYTSIAPSDGKIADTQGPNDPQKLGAKQSQKYSKMSYFLTTFGE